MRFKTYINLLLSEDVVEALKNSKKEINSSHDHLAKHRDAHAIIDHWAAADPNPKKKYTPWLVNQYHKGNIRQEDSGRAHEALTHFEKYKTKLQHADIYNSKHYNDLTDVEAAVKPHIGTASSNKEAKRIIKHEGADEIHNDKDLAVHKLKTKEAACHYGANTKWCTAAKHDNMFDQYHKKGPLYVIHDKKENQKYQFHFETEQFMDHEDKPVRIGDLTDKMPGLTKIKEFQNHPHYGFLFHPPEEHKKHLDKIFGVSK